MMIICLNILNSAHQKSGRLQQKPWLLGGIAAASAGAKPTDAVQRWLLPYADFLTVLFCITLLWCGLSLKQAHWLQIQNDKLHQALEQATQQATETNQIVEKQALLIAKLQTSVASTAKPKTSAVKPTASPLSLNSDTQQQKVTGYPVKPAENALR